MREVVKDIVSLCVALPTPSLHSRVASARHAACDASKRRPTTFPRQWLTIVMAWQLWVQCGMLSTAGTRRDEAMSSALVRLHKENESPLECSIMVTH
jgi:hypothetical protein